MPEPSDKEELAFALQRVEQLSAELEALSFRIAAIGRRIVVPRRVSFEANVGNPAVTSPTMPIR